MRWEDLESEPCSVARTLSVIGERWTLMVLRDCFLRVRRFEEFQARLGISRTILRDRLAHLVEAGVLTKEQYETRPPRYEYRLTDKGRALHPIIISISHWGDTYLPSEEGPALLYHHHGCGKDFHPVITCSECGDAVTARDVDPRPGPGHVAQVAAMERRR